MSNLGGTQCTIMAVAALILAAHVLGPDQWVPNDIDFVLSQGDSLYSYLVDSVLGGNHSMHFGHDQIPNYANLYGGTYQTHANPA